MCFHFPSFTLMQVPGFGPRSLFYLHRSLILCRLGGTNVVIDPVPKSTDPSLQLSPEQASPPPVPLLDHSVLLPWSFYFLAQDDAEASTDLGVTMDSGANPSLDSAGASAS
jgi:hypothetical protein